MDRGIEEYRHIIDKITRNAATKEELRYVHREFYNRLKDKVSRAEICEIVDRIKRGAATKNELRTAIKILEGKIQASQVYLEDNILTVNGKTIEIPVLEPIEDEKIKELIK